MIKIITTAPVAQNAQGYCNGFFKFTPYQNCIIHGVVLEPLASGAELIDYLNEEFRQMMLVPLKSNQPLIEGQLVRNFMLVPTGVGGNMHDWDTGFNFHGGNAQSTIGPFQFMTRPVPLVAGTQYLISGANPQNLPVNYTSADRPLAVKSLKLIVEFLDSSFRWVKLEKVSMSGALDGASYKPGSDITKCFELHANGLVRAVELRVPHEKATSANGTGAGIPAFYYRNYPYGAAYQEALIDTGVPNQPRGVVAYPWAISEESSSTVQAETPARGIVVFGDTVLESVILSTMWSPSVHDNTVRAIPVMPVVNTHVQRWYLGEYISNVFTPMSASRLEATGIEVRVLIQE